MTREKKYNVVFSHFTNFLTETSYIVEFKYVNFYILHVCFLCRRVFGFSQLVYKTRFMQTWATYALSQMIYKTIIVTIAFSYKVKKN